MTCWRCSGAVAAAEPSCRTCGAPVAAAASADVAATGAAGSTGTLTAPDLATTAWPAAGPGWAGTPAAGAPPGWGAAPAWGAAPGWGQSSGWSAPSAARPPQRLAQWLVGLLAVGVLVDLTALATGLVYRTVVVDLLDPAGDVTEQRVLDVEQVYGGVGVLQTVLLLTCGVLFLVWFSRVDDVVREMGARGLRHSHGWAVGSWFVPLLNLVRPKQMVDDAWRASDPDLPPGAGRLQGSAPPPWVTVWWALWVIMGFLYGAGLSTGETLEDLQRSVEVTLVADAMSAAAGALALLLVHRLSQRVRRLAGARGHLTGA